MAKKLRQVGQQPTLIQGSSVMPVPDPTRLTTEANDRLESVIKELLEVRLSGLEQLMDQKFKTINQRFGTFDEKFKGVADTFAGNDKALQAALLAQKSTVEDQNKANATAASKSEAAFTKQIDASDDKIESVKELVAQVKSGLDDKVAAVARTIDSQVGQRKGSEGNVNFIIGLAVAVAIIVSTVVGVISYSSRGQASSAPTIIEVPVPSNTSSHVVTTP